MDVISPTEETIKKLLHNSRGHNSATFLLLHFCPRAVLVWLREDPPLARDSISILRLGPPFRSASTLRACSGRPAHKKCSSRHGVNCSLWHDLICTLYVWITEGFSPDVRSNRIKSILQRIKRSPEAALSGPPTPPLAFSPLVILRKHHRAN